MKYKKLVLLLTLLPIFIEAEAQLKFATVRMQEVFQSMPQTIEANSQIEALAAKYEAEKLTLKKEYEKKYSDYVKSRKEMPENIRSRREQELLMISQSIEDFMAVVQNDIKQQQEKLLSPIKEELMRAIKSVGDEGCYAFIIDESQLLYQGINFEDITPFVKAKLDIK